MCNIYMICNTYFVGCFSSFIDGDIRLVLYFTGPVVFFIDCSLCGVA